MTIDRVADIIRWHEGLVLRMSPDPLGYRTVGFGRNIDANGLSHDEVVCLLAQVAIPSEYAECLLAHDIARARQDCERYVKGFKMCDEVRQAVCIDMMFNLGATRLLGFKGFLAALAGGNFEGAAKEMLNSLWARQVKTRAVELAQMMRTGEWPKWISTT